MWIQQDGKEAPKIQLGEMEVGDRQMGAVEASLRLVASVGGLPGTLIMIM